MDVNITLCIALSYSDYPSLLIKQSIDAEYHRIQRGTIIV